MSTPITALEGPLAALRESEIRLLTDIAATLTEMGDVASEDRQRLIEVAQDLRDLFFLVVIIGEFNAGKSTFINALLGDDLLPMGITPTTEAIELIKYGDAANRKPEIRPDGIREWIHPNTGARGVALVDTPGTGSVFQKHEKTAKSFLHRSDLVIFVISAKRAFAETERLYLELAKHYGKKIILVVNQVDLLGAGEQVEVRRFVERQVDEALDLHPSPLLFMTSAKEALNTHKSGSSTSAVNTGIEAIRAHLRGVFSEAPPAQQKLLAQLDMAEHVVRRHIDTVKSHADLVGSDTTKVRDVQSELEKQSEGLGKQLVSARADIDRVFEGMRQRGLGFIDQHLSIRRVGRSINREALQTDFQDTVIGRSLREISEASGGYINALIDNSRLYWRGVIERLNQLRDLMAQELGGLDAGIYAEQREALEDAIRMAEGELKSYSSGKVVGQMEEVFRTNISGFTTSSVAAIAGVILTVLALLTPGAPVAFVGATLALIVGAPVAAIGGYAAYRYYRRVSADAKKDFNQRIDQLQKTYHEALDTLTQKERQRLSQYGKQVLTPIFSRLDVLSNRYAVQQTELRQYLEQIATLRKGIKEIR